MTDDSSKHIYIYIFIIYILHMPARVIILSAHVLRVYDDRAHAHHDGQEHPTTALASYTILYTHVYIYDIGMATAVAPNCDWTFVPGQHVIRIYHRLIVDFISSCTAVKLSKEYVSATAVGVRT